MNKDTIHNINPTERFVRLAFSITLALIPFIIDSPLGDLALLPLLAIYPGLTAALGWDPLLAAVTGFTRGQNTPGEDAGISGSTAADEHGLAGHA